MQSILVLWILIAPISLIGGQTPRHVPAADCPIKDAAAPAPYKGLEQREIKALSDDDHRQLLAGHGMGLALAAELNRFPGPKHVLELAGELDLSDEQIGVAQAIFDEMASRAQGLGRVVIEKEAELDAGFAAGTIDQDSLARSVLELGRLRGELRLAHLRAHLQMRAAMSEDQVVTYDRLRGYRGASASPVPDS